MKITKHHPDCPRRGQKFYIISDLAGDGCPDCEMIEEEQDDHEALAHVYRLIGKEVDDHEIGECLRRAKARWS